MRLIPKGDWPDYRRDPQLCGRASFPIGGGLQEVKLIPDGSGDILLAYGGRIERVTKEWELRWQSRAFGAHYIAGLYDVDDDGELEIVTSNGREVLLISARTGEILWRENVAMPDSYGTYATMFQVHNLLPGSRGMQIVVPCFSRKEVLVFDCSSGARSTKLLHSLWMDDSYHPTTCIGDVNNDGVEEIVIARLGGVYVFDPITGRMQNQTLWNSDEARRRNYGHFELADIDNDGDLEAVILSDRVSRHIAVLDNDGSGRFSPLWDRFIQHIYPNDTTELRYTKNSLSDIDGDGLPEICVSIFNERGDERWHTEAIECATGKTMRDHPDTYLRGVQGIGQDGSFALFLSEEHDRAPKKLSTLRIETASGEVLWECERARFAERTIGTSPLRSQFKPDIFSNDEVWFDEYRRTTQFFVFKESGVRNIDLVSVAPSNAFKESICEARQQIESRIALIADRRLILTAADGRVYDPSNTSKYFRAGYHLTTEAHIAARPGPIPTVVHHEGRSFVIVPNFADEIIAFEWSNGAFHERWRIPGRSRLGYDNVFHSASIIRYMGEACVVVIDDSDLASAQLSLYDLQGTRKRSYRFPNFPPHSLGSRIGAYDWLAFEHSSGEALFISFYRSHSMNSEHSLAISLSSGEILWEVAHTGEGEYGRGVGAWGAASMHRTKETQEVVFCAKDTILRIDLETGILTHPPKLLTDYTASQMQLQGSLKEQALNTSSSIEDPFTAYGSVLLHDIDRDGIDELLCVSSFGGFGVLSDDMSARWWRVASFGDTLYRMPALCDLDGDGKLELIQGHATNEIRVYDAMNGVVKFVLDIGAIATDIISCAFEQFGANVLTGTNDGRLLLCGVSENKLVIKREWEVASAVGSPIVAEIDGAHSILFVSGDGKLQLCR